jgi:hypothetical protein
MLIIVPRFAGNQRIIVRIIARLNLNGHDASSRGGRIFASAYKFRQSEIASPKSRTPLLVMPRRRKPREGCGDLEGSHNMSRGDILME